MKNTLTPENLQNSDEFEYLTEVPHTKIKEFVMDQIIEEKHLIRKYSIYQVSMLILLVAIAIKALALVRRDISEPLAMFALAALFSFTFLVIFHELIHAAAYLLTGSRNLSFGAVWKKFIFYVAANKQVITPGAFRIVALAPFVSVKVITAILTVVYWQHPIAFFFLSIMCWHSLFCAGDIAMLAFYKLHHDKEIYNYDDVENKVTYFYYRRK